MTSSDSTTRIQADGRNRRTERSRHAMVAAMFELVGEGVLRPTAQQVAERAGVGIRTVFRHFKDMDTLFAQIDARLRDELAPLLEAPSPAGSVAQRARGMVRQRALLFERIAPYKRSANLQRWRSAFLRERHQRMVRQQRALLRRWLPELAQAPPELAQALDLVTSFAAWDRLRTDQRLGVDRARAAMERGVLALVKEL